MTINSLSASSYSMYSQYRSTNSNYINTTDQQTQRAGDPPPPPSTGSQLEGPDLDTDGNGLWSTEEIEEFSTYAEAALGTDIDTDEIMSTYDVNGDKSIDADEQAAMGEDNAFNLPSPRDMMNQMRGFSPPPNITSASEVTSSTDTESIESSQYIQQLIDSYTYGDSELVSEMIAPAFNVEL